MLIDQFPMENMTVVRRGEDLTLTCIVRFPDGADNDLIVFWTVNTMNNLGSISTTNLTEMTVTSVLQLQDIQPDQADGYFCVYLYDSVNLYDGNKIEVEVICECDSHVAKMNKCLYLSWDFKFCHFFYSQIGIKMIKVNDNKKGI